MTGRKKLPEGCWVTAFSSMLPVHAADSGMANHANAGRYRTRDVSEGLLAGARRSRALLTQAAPSPARRLDRVRARRKARQAQHLVPQELFTDALVREVRRADRFDEPFTLVVVTLNDAASSVVAQAMWSALGETAVVGWFSAPTVLAAVVPQLCVPDADAQVRRELRRSLDPASLLRCSIRSHLYTPNFTGTSAWDTADPQLASSHLDWRHRRPADYRSKRALDLVGSLALLCALAPVFLVVAAIVKLTSKGQVLFRQKRIGQMAQPFTMLKFRTMRVDADHTLHHQFVTEFIQSSRQSDGSGLFKLTNDPRVTPIGRILRKTSLDELPQLWNVVRGDMSLVGPRPPLPYEVEQYRPWHWRRVLDAKPGVTGLWQVVGRSRTTFDEMVRLDLQYVRTRSLWTDLRILLATPGAVISGNGAS